MPDTAVKKIHTAQVTRVEKSGRNTYLIEFDWGREIDVKAGQFVSIYCEGLTLRRPFSVYSQKGSKVSVLFKERGKGTKYIKSLKNGDIIDVVGPLGNGFNIEKGKSLLVGAGIGVAPISFLKNQLKKRGIDSLFICGFLTAEEVPQGLNADKVCTDDGTIGEKGSVLNYIGSIIQDYKPEKIYVCGPSIVLKRVSELGMTFGIYTEVAMEKVMACGIGVCRGCVITIKQKGTVKNATVCKDGPVFKGSEIVWQ